MKNLNCKFSKDEAQKLVDFVVTSTASIQYTRQAVYYYLLKSGEYTTKTLAAYVKQRATLKTNTKDFSRGAMVKEISTAQKCIDDKLIKGKFNTETSAEYIKLIGEYMQKNSLSYYFLFDEKKKRQNKKSGKAIKIDDVIEYIKSADKRALELIKSAAESALDSSRISAKDSTSNQVRAKATKAKATKAKAAKTKAA